MIKAGLNIGNSKISCVVCDYKNFDQEDILEIKEIKKNLSLNTECEIKNNTKQKPIKLKLEVSRRELDSLLAGGLINVTLKNK